MINNTIKYRTFNQLLDEVRVDFEGYDMEQHIKPQQLLKLALRINYELGIKIYKDREQIIDIEHYKAKLPNDFYLLNYAMLCGQYTSTAPVIQGVQTEEIVIAPLEDCTNESSSCQPAQTCLSQCGEYYQIIQKIKYETRTYEQFQDLYITPGRYVPSNCPNAVGGASNRATIKDGYIFTNIQCGQVYVNYVGNMENEDGELLVLDHPMINEYYEYALKYRILENMYMDGEDVINKSQMIQPLLQAARFRAISIARTPDFNEMKELWQLNRTAQYHKYYNSFRSI